MLNVSLSLFDNRMVWCCIESCPRHRLRSVQGLVEKAMEHSPRRECIAILIACVNRKISHRTINEGTGGLQLSGSAYERPLKDPRSGWVDETAFRCK